MMPKVGVYVASHFLHLVLNRGYNCHRSNIERLEIQCNILCREVPSDTVDSCARKQLVLREGRQITVPIEGFFDLVRVQLSSLQQQS